jgi:hypothetical protein
MRGRRLVTVPDEHIDAKSLSAFRAQAADDDRINERYALGDNRIVTEQAR